MSSSKRKRRSAIKLTEQLLDNLVHGKLAPAQLAEQLGLSLSELSAWASEPKNANTLENLARLADVRTQMLVSEYRASAAIRLIEIATDSKGGEISRKACVDLLRADLDAFKQSPTQTNEDQTPAQPSEQAILNALQELGEEKST